MRLWPKLGAHGFNTFDTILTRESLARRWRTLAQLENRAEAVAHRMTMLDSSSTLLGTCIREIQETRSRLCRVGAQDGNPLQCYRSAEESNTALRAALAVIEHSLPGSQSHRKQLHWPRLTAQTHAVSSHQTQCPRDFSPQLGR